ncbi:hypothetical protein PI125_g18818 [Phytophthora idaei]|nr:hypothetical protein PI125_g18818 [Phytophthora idaei]
MQFFQAVTVPDVLFNAGYGVEAALEDWRLVSLYHANQKINLERVERGVGNTVVAYMNGVFTITEMMLHSVFPDLESDSEGRKWLGLADKLLDKQLVVPSMVWYQFDEANRVVSGRYEANMLAPLLELLPSAEDVSLVLCSPINIHHWTAFLKSVSTAGSLCQVTSTFASQHADGIGLETHRIPPLIQLCTQAMDSTGRLAAPAGSEEVTHGCTKGRDLRKYLTDDEVAGDTVAEKSSPGTSFQTDTSSSDIYFLDFTK